MKLAAEKGMVTFKMVVGKDLVRNQMPLASANAIVKQAESVAEKGNELIIDNKYYFPYIKETKPRKKVVET